MSVLGRYITTHGRPFALRRKNGKGVVEVQFNDGYVTIHSRQPGILGFTQEIHITRKAWYSLLNSPQLKEVSRKMEGPSFDRYRAERQYYREEAEYLEEFRRQKAERRGSVRRRRVARIRARRGQA
jgi:hypothetical protein